MTDRPVLDHVSIGVPDASAAWPLFRDGLGGEAVADGYAPGFRYATLAYAGGLQVEILEPARTGESDFLSRFLAAGGPGMHHLTFRVPDLAAAVADVRSAGFPPLYVRLDNPDWQEAFLHPRTTGGTVVQLVEYPGAAMTAPDGERVAALRAVEWTPTDRETAARLLGGPLGGTLGTDGDDMEVRWEGLGAAVRLRAPAGAGQRRRARLVFAGVTDTVRAAYPGESVPALGIDVRLLA